MSSLTTRLAVALAGVLTPLFLSACSTSGPDRRSEHPSHTDKPLVTGQPAGYNADDVEFVDGMLACDQQGVDLSGLVPDRSTDPDVVKLAANSAAVRQSDIAVLRVLRVQWEENPDIKAGGGPHGTTLTGRVDDATIARLNSSHGNEFDTLWLRSMIGLNQGAVELSNAEIANGKNVDAIDVARRTVQARQAEIDQMKHILGN